MMLLLSTLPFLSTLFLVYFQNVKSKSFTTFDKTFSLRKTCFNFHSHLNNALTTINQEANLASTFNLPISTNTYRFSAIIASIFFLSHPNIAQAVSGGGKDYATKDLRGQDFSSQILLNKDFTQCDASGANFKDSKLKGSRFYRANLKDVDFTSADLSGVSLEDTSLSNAILKDSILEGAYLSTSIQDVSSIENADFTDAQMPEFSRKTLCTRNDAKGTNSKTLVETRESLFCE